MTEHTLYDGQGKRLYLTPSERHAFYEAAKAQPREIRTFCHTLHITGCRISEALELTPDRIDLHEQTVILRTLKKHAKEGEDNKPVFRAVPVPADYLDSLDMVHCVRKAQRQRKPSRLWGWSRTTGWRYVKAVMSEAGIDVAQPHATAKGLRHAYGIHAIDSGVPVTELQKLLGHASLETTAIYLNAVGEERRAIVSRMW